MIKMLVAFFFMFCIGWFVSFQINPYGFCDDHSDPKLKKDYYECFPLGFKLKKGSVLERAPENKFPWEQTGGRNYHNNRNKKKKNKVDCSKYYKILESENWEEEVYSIPSSCLDNLDDLEI
mgnify:CR=1 FL=1